MTDEQFYSTITYVYITGTFFQVKWYPLPLSAQQEHSNQKTIFTDSKIVSP